MGEVLRVEEVADALFDASDVVADGLFGHDDGGDGVEDFRLLRFFLCPGVDFALTHQ